MLQGIHCKGFTLLDDLVLGLSWPDLELQASLEQALALPRLQPLTCLIGRASTGKTSAFEALRFISESLKRGVPEAAQNMSDQGFSSLLTYQGEAEMGFSLVFFRAKDQDFLRYKLNLRPDQLGRPRVVAELVVRGWYEEGQFKQEVILQHDQGQGLVWSENFGQAKVDLLDLKMPALSLYGRLLQYSELCWLFTSVTRWFVADGQLELKRMPPARPEGAHRHLNPDFSNALNVLDYHARLDREKGRPDQTLENILERIPDFKITGDSQLDRELTSGNLKLFLYYLLLADDRPLICLDGPELGLYHERVEDLIAEIRLYLNRNPGRQFLISSHSTVLLDSLSPREIWLLARDQAEPGSKPRVKARWLGSDQLVNEFSKQGIGLGSLWYSGHLDFQ